MVDAGRRGFLRGFRRRPAPAQRPPWALPEDRFIDLCQQCDACIAACPPKILLSGEGRYPTVDFARGACDFCAACVTACQSGALLRVDDASRPWRIAALIGDTCLPRQGVECRVCGEVCATGAIRFQPTLRNAAQPVLDSTRCTGCGACVAPCPSGAIRVVPPAAEE